MQMNNVFSSPLYSPPTHTVAKRYILRHQVCDPHIAKTKHGYVEENYMHQNYNSCPLLHHRPSKRPYVFTRWLKKTVLILLCGLIISSSGLAASARCKVINGLQKFFSVYQKQRVTGGDAAPTLDALEELKNSFAPGEPLELNAGHQEKIKQSINSFKTAYETLTFPGTNEMVVRIHIDGFLKDYADTIEAIMNDSPAGDPQIPAEKALRAVGALGQLFAILPTEHLDRLISEKVWLQKVNRLASPNQAFAANSIRINIYNARYNSGGFGASPRNAFSGAVRWTASGAANFSELFTNDPEYPGTKALPKWPEKGRRGGPFFEYTGNGNTLYRITDVDMYITWLKNEFYGKINKPWRLVEDGGQMVFRQDPAPANALSPYMERRIRAYLSTMPIINNQSSGLPGAHAEVLAANNLVIEGFDPDAQLEALGGVHTVRTDLGKGIGNHICTSFECCPNCTGILNGRWRSTSGGGSQQHPFHRH